MDTDAIESLMEAADIIEKRGRSYWTRPHRQIVAEHIRGIVSRLFDTDTLTEPEKPDNCGIKPARTGQ